MPVEDTILKILEARARGLDDKSTAKEVGLPVFIATRYEKITKRAIREAISNGAADLEEIARQVRLPRTTVNRFMSYYGISLSVKVSNKEQKSQVPKGIELSEGLPKPINWRQLRAEQIREAISSGADNLNEIGERVGLAPATVRAYAYKYRIKLPRAQIAENRRLYRAEQIREAISSGADNLDEIAQIVGLAPATVRDYAYQNGIKLPSARVAKRKGKVALIQQAIDGGAASVSDMSRRIGISESSVLYCAKIDDFPLAKKIRANRAQKKAEAKAEKIRKAVADGAIGVTAISRRTGLRDWVIRAFAKTRGLNVPIGIKAKHIAQKEAIQKALQEGVDSLEELCRRSEYTPVGFRVFCERNDISLPDDLVPYRFKPKIDKLVDEGQSLETIASIVDMGRESVRVYLLDSGQYSLWKKARERRANEDAELKEVRGNLASLLTAKWVNSLRNKSWPYQMAVDYMTNHPGNRLPLSKLVVLFARYETAIKEGRKLSLEELSKGLGTWYSHTSQILRLAGLEPMYGTNVRSSPASKEKVSAMKRGLRLGMSGNDVAYFLGLPAHVVDYRFAGKGNGRPLAKVKAVAPLKWRGLRKLTYSLASQIYEAADAGFNKEETVELLDTNMAIVDFALSRRNTFEPKIIKKLKVLYNSDIDKPYS